MLNFPVDISTPSPLQNSSIAVIVAVDDVLIAFRNMMEDWVDPTYQKLEKDPSFPAANRLRNIGAYTARTKQMLESALLWVSIRACTRPGWAEMIVQRKVYVVIDDEYIASVGYKITFIVDEDIMQARILDTDGSELANLASPLHCKD